MRGFAIRLLIALVCVAIAGVLIPILLRMVGLSMSADIETVLRIVIGLSALYYVIWGSTPPMPPG